MMTSSVARRYAKALFGLAVERGRIDRWSESLAALQRAVCASPELQDVFANPAYRKEQRRAIMAHMGVILLLDREPANLLSLLAERNRLSYLEAIIDVFRDLADEALGRLRARVVSAAALDPVTARGIATKLAAVAKAEVLIDQAVDPSLLGGVVAQVGNMVYDGSIRTQLEDLRRRLKA